MTPLKLTVIGCGYLGAVHAAAMAHLGHHVLGIDTRPEQVEALSQGRAPFYEPGLPELLVTGAQQGDLRFEPPQALAAGPDGLDDLRIIIGGAPAHLNPGGWLLLEHGYDQEAPVQALLRDAGFADVFTRRDLAGQPRVSGGRWQEDGRN